MRAGPSESARSSAAPHASSVRRESSAPAGPNAGRLEAQPSTARASVANEATSRSARRPCGRLALARKPGELLSNLVRFVVLQLERSLPVCDRLRDVTLALREVAQVLLDRRIIRLALLCLGEQALRLLETPEAEIDPTERVEVRPVARLARDGFLEELPRFLETDPSVGPHVAEVVLRRRVVGPSLQDLLKRLLRLAGGAGPLERGSESEESFGAVGEARGRLSSDPGGRSEILHPCIDIAGDEHLLDVLRGRELSERFLRVLAVARAVSEFRDERGPLGLVGLSGRGGAGDLQSGGEVLLFAGGRRENPHGAGVHRSLPDCDRRQDLCRARVVFLEDCHVTELHVGRFARGDLLRIVRRAANAILENRLRLGEPTFANQLSGQSAPGRVVVGAFSDEQAKDLLAFRRAASLEENLSEEAPDGPVLGPFRRPVTCPLLGLREPPGPCEIESDPFGDRRVFGVELLQLLEQ